MAAIMSEAFFTAWLVETAPAPAPTLRIYEERPGVRPAIVARIARRVVEDYVGVETLLKAGGFVKAAALVRSSLPDNKRTRSGDLGEIVASEYIDSETSFRVPVPKLQWKSDRQMPMHGNDVIAIDVTQPTVRILKGESKSAAAFSTSQVSDAVTTLDAHGGRPNPSTIGFIIKRLYELGRDPEAKVFEKLLCASALKPSQITHHIFALCGNDPSEPLKQVPAPKRHGVTRLAAAVVVKDHAGFVAAVFRAAHGPQS